MISPKSRHKRERRERGQPRREHKNDKFYKSKAWQQTRSAYLRHLEHKVFTETSQGFWSLRNGEIIKLNSRRSLYLLSLDFIPCEICTKLYVADVYEKVEPGVELDHIQPLNPENALESVGHGDPFSHDNLQLLCKRHHARKSQREAKSTRNRD